MSCWIPSSCSSRSMRAVSAAMSLMDAPVSFMDRARASPCAAVPGCDIFVCNAYKTQQVMAEILTTHVGSLPRPHELAPLLLERDHGRPYDAAAFDRLVQAAVEEAVARQEAAGVSIVSDGELGKVGYSTYITERLSGFGG